MQITFEYKLFSIHLNNINISSDLCSAVSEIGLQSKKVTKYLDKIDMVTRVMAWSNIHFQLLTLNHVFHYLNRLSNNNNN